MLSRSLIVFAILSRVFIFRRSCRPVSSSCTDYFGFSLFPDLTNYEIEKENEKGKEKLNIEQEPDSGGLFWSHRFFNNFHVK